MGFSTEAKNDGLDGLWADVGIGSVVQVRTGAEPSDASVTGTLLGYATLVAEPAAASSGVIAVSSVNVDIVITTAGTIGHVRVTKADGTTGHLCWAPSELDGAPVIVGDTVRSNSLSMAFPDLA